MFRFVQLIRYFQTYLILLSRVYWYTLLYHVVGNPYILWHKNYSPFMIYICTRSITGKKATLFVQQVRLCIKCFRDANIGF